MGKEDWKLIEGFKTIHHFRVEITTGNKEGSEEHYHVVDNGEEFFPEKVLHMRYSKYFPTHNIGIVGEMRNENDANRFLLVGADDVFILNDEGKTIERI